VPAKALKNGSLDADFRIQSSMNRTSLGNVEQPEFLRLIQVAAQFDFAIDAVQESLLRFTVDAIFGMNSGMPQRDRDALQIHSLSLCVQPQRHRCACAKSAKQQIMQE
jgi:hypothetical protein